MSEGDERLSPLVKKVDKLISKITSSGQHSSSNLINEVGQVCVELTPSRDQSWRAAKRVLAVGSIENKGYLAMCLVDSIVRHETKHKSPDARCSFADLFSDHVCRLTRRALSVHATDSELGRMSKMIQGWVVKKRFDSGVTKKLKSLVPDASDALHNGSHRRRQSKRKRRSRDLDDGVSPTVSPSRAGVPIASSCPRCESPKEGVSTGVQEEPIAGSRPSGKKHRSSSHGRRSFGRHADNDVNVELPKTVPQHGGWDVPPVQPPPPYSAQGFNNPMGGFPLPPPTGGRPTPPGPAFVPPQFPSVMGMPQAVFGAPRQQPLYTIPAATPSPPPPPGPAFGQRPQGVNVDVTTATRSGDDDDESSEMDIDSPRVVGEKEEEEVAVVVEKKEGAGVEPVKDGGSPTAAEDADALDSLGEVSNQEGRQGGEEEEEDEFDWD
ncbi:hypothetical protein Pmar_PMAR025944 [Perkinsus marinus ATCC 50983]|uniref:CID domain-containing protein n=1 Tax=Perkinsus marinus (strain ATCC 50983 / TXsc) TaxID=423536 RepID=C5L1G4_PERM5|nr:hypothetical protein Pmar_PMAR025944 [Perkinsus marinus ATCC 50983]EER09391.1 hypothetical protein Pmar_PMAR025944 [Perkinsus marinus ATCC 50983]|eukprot:XP_002777575.1 hypothetical protein Pmar_PMAR025944 [Perkinsus marinus ATCC 50983]